MSEGLPFLTLPDPVTTGEGALDPLGLATIADHLAEDLLPGLRARMARPRFLTAIAASAAVCAGLEEELAEDGMTPSYLVCEWLVVEAFVRAADRELTVRTPGTAKTRTVLDNHEHLCARTYLRVPTVFGFHGIYKPLARNLGLVDDDMRLSDSGYELLKVWQTEQGLEGFLESSSMADGPGDTLRRILRAAVEDGLKHAHTRRSGGWQGWRLLATHLPPGATGPKEAEFLSQLLVDDDAAPRGEVFRLLAGKPGDELTEEETARELLLPAASPELAARLKAAVSYESVCGLLEAGFEWIRHLSTRTPQRPITTADFGAEKVSSQIAAALPKAIEKAEAALAAAPLLTQQQFAELVKSFDGVRDSASLFEALLEHHSAIQGAKKPDGKRDWFERAPDGATVVRLPYRQPTCPAAERPWNRPYRISTVQSFLRDLKGTRLVQG